MQSCTLPSHTTRRLSESVVSPALDFLIACDSHYITLPEICQAYFENFFAPKSETGIWY